MTWTVAIDTSHHVAVGLARDTEALDSVIVAETRSHGEKLMPSVMDVLERNGVALTDVDGFVIGMGPGPFTGLRVGIATAVTLAAMAGVEPRRVCSLDALALQWKDAPRELVIASDARRKELYWATYRDGVRVGEPRVSAPADLPELPVAGAVPAEYRGLLDWVADGPQALDPAVLAARWGELATAGEEPYYLRPADATVGGPPKSTLPRLRAR